MKINNFQGELTDISAKKEALSSDSVYVYANIPVNLPANLLIVSIKNIFSTEQSTRNIVILISRTKLLEFSADVSATPLRQSFISTSSKLFFSVQKFL